MSGVAYRDLEVRAGGLELRVHVALENRSSETWPKKSMSLGWQFFDPQTNRFILEGDWTPLACDVAPGGIEPLDISIVFPPEAGSYQIFIAPVEQPGGWAYARGEAFIRIVAEVDDGQVRIVEQEITTVRALGWRRLRRSLPMFFSGPWRTVVENRRLIRSMARRDILARYRGSFGDVFWTVLNPLLLMATYFFVFGVVLRTRFGADQSSTGFALYFLAGMLPWLAFSEPAGRSPYVIIEHRTFVKKLVFPLDTLSVNHTISGFVTEMFATVVFLCFLIALRHHVPATVSWLPVLLIPQLMFTLGLCWFLAALGVFVRDLAQVIGFLLTLWFFVTPICYPEQSLPHAAAPLLAKNPVYVLVRGYRAIFLEGHAPALGPLWKLWLVALAVFVLGHAWFYKLRKSFADII